MTYWVTSAFQQNIAIQDDDHVFIFWKASAIFGALPKGWTLIAEVALDLINVLYNQ